MSQVKQLKELSEGPSLKRKLNQVFSKNDEKLVLEERTASVSSTDLENLSDKFDQSSSTESSDDEQQITHNKKIKIARIESTVNLTERYLVEPDDSNLQTALVIKSFDQPFIIDSNYPKPENLSEHEILIENKFIGLNPIDWKGKKYRFGIYSFPWIQGRESSGIVIEKGSRVSNLEIGDNVFLASTSYRDLKTSTFQQFTVLDSRLVWKLPENITLKESSGIGVSLVTAGSVIDELNLNLFGTDEVKKEKVLKKRKSLLIWGGSSSVGSYIIQFAKLAKFEKIISVSSKTHEFFLKSIGVTHILDRFKPFEELEKELLEIVGEDGLQIGIDVVGKETSDDVIKFLNLNKTNEETKTFVGVVSKPSFKEDSNLLKNIEVKQVLIKKFHEDIKYGSNFVQKTYTHLLNSEVNFQKNLKVYKGFEGIKTGLDDLEKYGASNEKYIVEL